MSSGARSPISNKILVSKEEEEEAGGGDAMAVRMKPLFKKEVGMARRRWKSSGTQVIDEELSG